jgi:hypothetical protein
MDENILNISNNPSKIFNKYLDELTKYIKNKNKNLSWCLPIIKIIKSNLNFILLIFLFVTLYYSSYFINLFQFFILFDSIILSTIVLQSGKDKVSSRRLAKNVISLFVLTINIIGSLFSILLVLLIYFSFNKFISKSIFKIIEIFINFVSSTLPFIKDLYPSIHLIDHNKHFESTELVDSDDSVDSDNSVDSVNPNNTTLPNIKNKKEYKFYKKLMDEIKTDK